MVGDGNSTSDHIESETSTSEMLVTMGSSHLEEFYPAVAISALMRIMRDQSLSTHHTTVIQAVHFIFNNLGMKGKCRLCVLRRPMLLILIC